MTPQNNEGRAALSADELDEYVDALLSGAPFDEKMDAASFALVGDLLALADATPLRDGLAAELQARLLREATASKPAATPAMTGWRAVVARFGAPRRNAPARVAARQRPAFVVWGLAGAATLLLIIVALGAFLFTPDGSYAAELTSKIAQAADDPSVFGLSSYHGKATGWTSDPSNADPSFQQTWRYETWFLAPAMTRKDYRLNPSAAATVAAPAPGSSVAPYLAASGFSVFIRGAEATIYSPGDNLVSLLDAGSKNGSVEIQKYRMMDLGALIHVYGNDLDVRVVGTSNIAGRAVSIVAATSQAARGSLLAWIDQETYVQLGGEVKDTFLGITTGHWAYDSFDTNITLKPDLFNFTPPADATVDWERPVSFAEQVARWQQVAAQVNKQKPYQVFMPVYTPANLRPQGPQVMSNAGIQQYYISDVIPDETLGLIEGPVTSFGNWGQGQQVQIGDFSGYLNQNHLLLRKSGTQIDLSISSPLTTEELLKVGGSLQEVGGPGQAPQQTTPVPAVLSSPQPIPVPSVEAPIATPAATVVLRPITREILLRPVEVKDDAGKTVAPQVGDLEKAGGIIKQRLEALGIANGQVYVRDDGLISVTYVGPQNPLWIAPEISGVGLLEWISSGSTYFAPGTQLCTTSGCGNSNTPGGLDNGKPYQIVISNADVVPGSVKAVATNIINLGMVEFTLNSSGTSKLASFTAAHIGEYMPILLDQRVLDSPIIQSAITGANGVISNISQSDAQQIAAVLRYGPLPVQLNVVSVNATPLAATK